MNMLYERISMLCTEKGIRPGKMCTDLGISRGNISDLKMGRIESLSADKLSKISAYFNVSVDYLLTGEETKKAPTPEGEREIGFDDFTYAFYEESKDLPDEKKKMLLEMARFMKADIEKEKG
mgnify:CR=1 FL=1